MKIRKTYLHLISATILGVAIFLSVGSFGGLAGELIKGLLSNPWEFTSDWIGDSGIKTETKVHVGPEIQYIETRNGKTDEKGRWHGPHTYTKVATDDTSGVVTTEVEIETINGKMHGKGIRTRWWNGYMLKKDTICCYEDIWIECDSFDLIRTTDTSAFSILVNHYPIDFNKFWAFLQGEELIKAYMDTLEEIINSYPVNATSYDDFYDDALEELEATPFDSLTLLNSDLTFFNLFELMKDCQFRLAVFDQQLKGINSLYQVFTTFYPGFLSSMNSLEVSNEDFEKYCNVFDSLMVQFDPLDTEHFSFPDSMDARMLRVFSDIDSLYSDGLIGDVVNRKTVIPWEVFQTFGKVLNGRGLISDINTDVIVLSIEEFILLADIIRVCQREAYYKKHSFISFPTVTTHLRSQNSNTEAEIQGYVTYDGGTEVTKRGILWAQHYNPTMDDNQENAGNGSGPFTATLSTLTPGETYYARSFASNSAGTSYGNCVEFVAQQVTGIKDLVFTNNSLLLFPNPASTVINIQSAKNIASISILDINGKIVQTLSGNLDVDKQIRMDISSLPDGVYVCSASYANRSPLQKKFLVLH